jgi:hypothetical protein
MSGHLDARELAAAVAGLELDPAAREHLESCLACRQQVGATVDLVAARRASLATGAPDWEEQRRAILARLPACARVVPLRPQAWWRPALAAAAVVALAAAVLLLRPRPAPPVAAKPVLAVEQILAEVDATLDGPAIPGFAPLGSLVPGVDNEDTVDAVVTNGAS